MKRGRKPLTIKNTTFTMSINWAERQKILEYGPTLQKGMRNIIKIIMQAEFEQQMTGEKWEEALKETAKAAKSLMK